MKAIRVLLSLIGVLLLLIVAAVVIIPLVVDPNDFKPQISQLVQERTGRELQIPGEIDLSIFPWLALELGEVQLSNAEGFGKEPFARVGGAEIRVKLLPLLERNLEIDTVVLNGLQLNLIRTEDGQTNWQDLVAAAQEPAAEPEPAPSEEPGVPIAAFAIGGVQVKDARIVWADHMADQRLILDDLRIQSGTIEPRKPVNFEVEFDLENQQPELATHTILTGELSANPELTNFKLSDLTLQVQLLEGPDNLQGNLELQSLVQANTTTQIYQIEDLQIQAKLQGQAVPGGHIQTTLSGGAVANLEAGTMDVRDLLLSLYGLELKGGLQGTQILTNPQFTGKFTVVPFSPRELLQSLGQEIPNTADASVLQRSTLNFGLQGTTQQVEISNLKMQLDDSTLTGSAQVKNFTDPAIQFALNLDAIDLDRYLPPPTEGPSESAPPPPAEATAAAAAELPVETLRELNMNGTAQVGRLKAGGLTAEDIKLTVKAKEGKLNTTQKVGSFYQGNYSSSATLDVSRSEVALWSVEEELKGVQAGPMLADLLGEKRLSGTTELTAHLKGRGVTADQLKANTQGTVSFAFQDGAVHGINIARIIREAQARLKGEALPASAEENKTDFTILSGSLQIADGIVRNDDLTAKSPLLRVTGEGQVNLVTEQVDYLIKPVLVKTLEGQGGTELEELKGIPIPIRVVGDLDSPSYKLDTEALVDATARAKIEEEKVKAKEKVEKKLQETIREKLGGDEETQQKVEDLFKGFLR